MKDWWTMKLLLALLGASAMISFAAPAIADPGNYNGDDAGFLTALKRAGITYSDPAQAIGSAKAVCGCLDNGETGLELVHDVKNHNPGFTMDAASQFALIASQFYCPHHLSKA